MKPLIKICGIKTPELAYKTAIAGADYVGIMCFEKSKRYVNLDLAQEISLATKAGGAIPVPVCVDQNYDELMSLVEKTQVTALQLHGDISRQSLDQLPKDMTKIYVLPINKQGELTGTIPDILDQSKDYLLFDSDNPGTGQSIATHQLDELAHGYHYFLAGGLTVESIENNEFVCHPAGFDVSSGVENEQGIKTIDKISAFIQAVKEVK